MTAGLPGLRTVPSPLAPRLQAGADLHVHTTHSDGLCSPCEVVIAAAGAGLAALAITDHDTVSALAIARPEAARLGLELVAGAELTCELNGREVHLLGHFLGDDDPSLLAALGWLRGSRTAAASHGREAAGPRPGSRPGCAAAILSPRCAGPPSCRPIPGADRSGRQRARGVCKLPGRWLPGLCAQAAAGCLQGHRPDSGRRGRRGARTPAVRFAGGNPRSTRCRGPWCHRGGWAGNQQPPGPPVWRWADEFHLVPIAGSDFHAPDRPGRWVGSITTPPADLEAPASASGPTSESIFGQLG